MVFPITFGESKLVCLLTWNSFDRLCYTLSYGTDAELACFTPMPVADFREKVEDMVLVNTDAVPIYADPSTDKVLVPTDVLHAQQKRRFAKKHGLETEAVPDMLHLCASGDSRQDKNRLTWLARLAVHNGFKKGTEENPAPRLAGRVLKSHFFVHCETTTWLDDICSVTNTWLRSHSFSENGKHVNRVKGEPVPKTLLTSWRAVRDLFPDLFINVVVIGNQKAYQNEINCARHAELLQEEIGDFLVMHQVDMFSGELSETVEKVNFILSQCKTLIGPKLTAKLQSIDVWAAICGKNASRDTLAQQRRRMRRKAKLDGVSSKLSAGAYECMELVNSMHDALVKEAKQGKVEMTFRKCGFFAVEPGPKGMRPTSGPRWDGLPLGGSNLPQSFLDDRLDHFDSDFIPCKPDWARLHELRLKQQREVQVAMFWANYSDMSFVPNIKLNMQLLN